MKKVLKMFIVAAVLIICGYRGIAGSFADYKANDQLEETLQQAVTETQEAEELPYMEGEVGEHASLIRVHDDGTIEDISSTLDPLPEEIRDLHPDFSELSTINSNVVAWIYIPAVDINYPVIQGEDNEEFLHLSFDGKKNRGGSVLLACENKADFSDENTFICSHNMANRSMFGNLKTFIEDVNTVDVNPYIYVFTPDHIYQYEIFSAYKTSKDSEMYVVPEAEYHDIYVNAALEQSLISHDCDTEGRLLTLSTCSGVPGSGKRLLVHGSLVATF